MEKPLLQFHIMAGMTGGLVTEPLGSCSAGESNWKTRPTSTSTCGPIEKRRTVEVKSRLVRPDERPEITHNKQTVVTALR